jgi:hypothetical protein
MDFKIVLKFLRDGNEFPLSAPWGGERAGVR